MQAVSRGLVWAPSVEGRRGAVNPNKTLKCAAGSETEIWGIVCFLFKLHSFIS